MDRPHLARIRIDHHLQGAILSRLAAAEGPVRFSDLKEDGIENSLFMYHANKLLSRGAITKDERGFTLTPNGARWINATNRDMLYADATPRPLIHFVVRSGDRLLLSIRKGQLKEHLNDYALPSELHEAGMSADENAARILKAMFEGLELLPEFVSTVENISTYDDGFVYHSFGHVYSVDLPEQITPVYDARFAPLWMPLDEVTAQNPLFASSKFVPLFMQKLLDKSLQPREVIRILNY